MSSPSARVFVYKARQLNLGFSLLEVIVALMLVGLLVAVALPSFNQYIVKANRAEAMEKLTEIMFEQERYQLNNGIYTLNLEELGYKRNHSGGVETANAHYIIAALPCNASLSLNQCVLLEARPKQGSQQALANEVPLRINSLGEKHGPWQ